VTQPLRWQTFMDEAQVVIDAAGEYDSGFAETVQTCRRLAPRKNLFQPQAWTSLCITCEQAFDGIRWLARGPGCLLFRQPACAAVRRPNGLFEPLARR
jgi:hypothetical protein